MQPTPTVHAPSAAQILTHLLALENRNDQTWEGWFAEDAVFESPYSPRTPRRVEGRAAVCNFIKTVFSQMQDLRFSNVRVYPTTDPNLAWAEFHGEAVAVATGRPYQQDYVVKLETRDGQITLYRDYGNPLSVIEAWGDAENLNRSFNPEETR